MHTDRENGSGCLEDQNEAYEAGKDQTVRLVSMEKMYYERESKEISVIWNHRRNSDYDRRPPAAWSHFFPDGCGYSSGLTIGAFTPGNGKSSG